MEQTITVTLPKALYDLSARLVKVGVFSDIEDVVKTGIRHVLLEWSAVEGEAEPLEPGLEQYTFYLDKLRREITAAGGIFPGKTREEAIEMLRQTREQIYEEKYAAHFRRQ